MSRKARISKEEQKEWSCVRAWTATKGYAPYKPGKYLEDALIILEHEGIEESNPMRVKSGLAQNLLFEDSEPVQFSNVLVVDVRALLVLRDTDEQDKNILEDEAAMSVFGKRMEKPQFASLIGYGAWDATLVTRGVLCQLPSSSSGSRPADLLFRT